MSAQSVNTARFNALTEIESLNAEQLAAVRALRRFAESQAVAPYTVGVLCQRRIDLLERLQDGRRYARLSPASRELLIAEARELVEPFEPAVVAVWSHWCEANGLKPEGEYGKVAERHAQAIETAMNVEPEAVADAIIEHASRKYEHGARARCMAAIQEILADGPMQRRKVIKRLEERGFNHGTAQNAMRDLDIEVVNPGKGGQATLWRLPRQEWARAVPRVGR